MADKKKFAVVLSGCGVFDGAEVQESVLTLLAIARHGGAYTVFAPDIDQAHVINHLSGEEMPETRNVRTEAARIARGAVEDLAGYDAAAFDGLVMPGGFGAAKNLSSFAFDGPECTVHPDVERAVRSTVAAGKPVGALCIAPAILARLLEGVEVTIGSDPGTAEAIGKMGGVHTVADHGEVVVDPNYKVLTTPCYMLDATIDQIADGADNVIAAMLAAM